MKSYLDVEREQKINIMKKENQFFLNDDCYFLQK